MGKRANGEGSIYFDKKHLRYEGQFWYDDPETGQRRKKKLIGKTKVIVSRRGREFIAAVKKERADSLLRQSQASSIEEWLKEWLESYIKPSVRVKTYERYVCSIKNHINPYIGMVAIDQLKAETVQQMLNRLLQAGGSKHDGLSPRTVNAARRTLKSALDKACHLRMITYNPVDATKACRTEKSQITILNGIVK